MNHLNTASKVKRTCDVLWLVRFCIHDGIFEMNKCRIAHFSQTNGSDYPFCSCWDNLGTMRLDEACTCRPNASYRVHVYMFIFMNGGEFPFDDGSIAGPEPHVDLWHLVRRV